MSSTDDADDKLKILKSTAKYQQSSPGKQWVHVSDVDDQDMYSEASSSMYNSRMGRGLQNKNGNSIQSTPMKAMPEDPGNYTAHEEG